jgi:hypothetical protein
MKVTLPTAEEGFILKDAVLAGERLTLVQPSHIGTRWNKDNLIFRSSIWTQDGEPVSLGFKKFFNYHEHPELAGDPRDLKKINIMEKIDGSCLIVSTFKGQLITRTRGTFDAGGMDNAYELDILKEKYPYVFHPGYMLENESWIYEWVSPANRIVVGHPEPDIVLINKINHEDYSYASQEYLDKMAPSMGVKRPKRYKFDHVDSALEAISAFTGTEGVCFYFNNDQDIKKVKSLWYLSLHRFKENCNFESVLDFFLSYGCPDFVEFREKLTNDFDFECMTMAMPFASQISDAYREVKKIQEHMKGFVEPLKQLNVKHGFREGRKRAAQEIGKAYGSTNRASFAFQMLDGKDFDKEAIKKLIFQVTKK